MKGIDHGHLLPAARRAARIGAQPVGQYTACRTCAHDDEIELTLHVLPSHSQYHCFANELTKARAKVIRKTQIAKRDRLQAWLNLQHDLAANMACLTRLCALPASVSGRIGRFRGLILPAASINQRL